MTLIASLEYAGSVMLIGDVLISKKTNPSKPLNIDLPLHENPNEELAKLGLVISDLQQKIHIIESTVAVAWAGTQIFAMSMVLDLEELLKDKNNKRKLLEQYFQELPGTPEGTVSLIVHCYENGEMYSYFNEIQEIDSSRYKNVYASGSGVDEFRKIVAITENDNQSKTEKKIDITQEAIVLANKLLTSEYRTIESLKNFYGGAFEVAVFRENEFMKIDDRAHYFGEMIFKKEHSQNTMLVYSKYDYVRDLLLIRTEDWRNKENESIPRMHLVRPITKSKTDYTLVDLESSVNIPYRFDGKNFNYVIYARFDNDEFWISVEANSIDPQAHKLIEFPVGDKEIGLRHSDRLQHYVRTQLTQIYAKALLAGSI